MFDNPWILGSPTFGGNPLACAAFIATIKYMLENDIPGQMKAKGDYYLEGLKKLHEKYPTVLTAYRGAGLLICMEFPEAEIGHEVTKELFARKVMVAGTSRKCQDSKNRAACNSELRDYRQGSGCSGRSRLLLLRLLTSCKDRHINK